MANLERRLQKLEEAAQGVNGGSAIGMLSVTLDVEQLRAVSYRAIGFCLEAIELAAAPDAPRICLDGIDFEKIVRKVKRKSALVAQLQRMRPEERERQAKRHGYRILYPPAAADV